MALRLTNAGPRNACRSGAPRCPSRSTKFVEEIPFRETRGYVQGIIRNSAQYRRLYDENGNFKTNVGTKPLRGEIDTKSKEQLALELPDVVIASDEAE